ncbi:MAG TPA: hypothetical protein VG294_16745 [Solirubrobacteraceae bacterium]|jgi:hypothetical protein|nr:hypothetical protein [Solirubrobacteraceae bacterium]
MTMTGTSLASTTLLGKTSVQSLADNDAAGSAEAFRYTAAASGNAGSISFYVDAGSSAKSVTAGIYSNSSGHAKTLLATGTISGPKSSSWNIVGLNSSPSLTAGQTYWVAVLGLGGTLNFRDIDPGSGNCSQNSAQSTLSNLPATWSTGVSWTTCTVSAYVSASASSPAPPPPPVLAPVNTAIPVVTGNTVQGNTLSTSNGSWANSPTSFAYQWQDCGSTGGSCTNISGAIASTYMLTTGNVGHGVRAIVVAANSGGSASANSAMTPMISAPSTPPPPPAAPTNTAVPLVSGTTTTGQTLSTTPGTWSGSPTSYAYAWQDCDGTGSTCSNISGATSSTYTLVNADVNHTIRAVVTASNAGGSISASSPQTAVVSAPTTGGGGGSTGMPSGVSLKQIDGGPTYYSHFSNTSAWDNPAFYPISVFDQTLGYNGSSWDPTSLTAYHNVGVNGFISLYNGYNQSMLNGIQSNSMWVFDNAPAPSYANPITGIQWFDEADGINQCGNMPSSSLLGESVGCSTGYYGGSPSATQIGQITADLHGAKGAGDPTRVVYGNYTGGNIAWPAPPNSNSAAYVNAVDIASYDDYIITGGYDPDHNLWRQYDDVQNTRAEANYSHPIWAYIEAGNPETSGSWSGITPTPAMETAEAWNLIIGGARGISWFDHSFCSCGGMPMSSDTLIDSNSYWAPLQAAVKAWDQEVTSIAPVINSPFANGYVTHSGSMNVMAKYNATQNNFYVFAAPRFNASQNITFTIAGGYSGPVTVVNENRTVQATNGQFTDNFANQTAVHIYQIPNA